MKGRLVDVNASIRRYRKHIQYVYDNVKIGTAIKAKVDRGNKGECFILKLDRVEGQHYIFKHKFGWVQTYTLPQLCLDIEDGYVKILKEEKEND